MLQTHDHPHAFLQNVNSNLKDDFQTHFKDE